VNEIPLPAFERAIREMHGHDGQLVGHERVVEMHQGEVVWEGDVLVFQLVGHPSAQVVYAWEVDGTVTAVLGEPPVRSASDAVRAAIMAGSEYERPGRA